jgi:hypothetical protein
MTAMTVMAAMAVTSHGSHSGPSLLAGLLDERGDPMAEETRWQRRPDGMPVDPQHPIY